MNNTWTLFKMTKNDHISVSWMEYSSIIMRYHQCLRKKFSTVSLGWLEIFFLSPMKRTMCNILPTVRYNRSEIKIFTKQGCRSRSTKRHSILGRVNSMDFRNIFVTMWPRACECTRPTKFVLVENECRWIHKNVCPTWNASLVQSLHVSNVFDKHVKLVREHLVRWVLVQTRVT